MACAAVFAFLQVEQFEPAMAVVVPECYRIVISMAEAQAAALHEEPLDFLEVFGGCGHMSEAMLEEGMKVWKIERADSTEEDVLTPEALCKDVDKDKTCFPRKPRHKPDTFTTQTRHKIAEGCQLVLEKLARVRPGGLAFFAPPCSTWIWIARGHTKRSKSNVKGNEERPCVLAANYTAEMLSSLFLLCRERRVHFIVEQPSSSQFFDHPDAFESDYAKPTVLVGNAPYLSELEQIVASVVLGKPRQQLARVCANGRVTGKNDLLQMSASYPMPFCNCLAELSRIFLHGRFESLTLCIVPLFQQRCGNLFSKIAEVTYRHFPLWSAPWGSCAWPLERAVARAQLDRNDVVSVFHLLRMRVAKHSKSC
eukprot:6492114-Amphidinium_carterae.2